MNPLQFALERDTLVRAPRATVFCFLTDSGRFARWWGAGSTIDPRVGGTVRIHHPGGIETEGEVLELRADERIVFTFGFPSGQPIPVGGSVVSVTLRDDPLGARVLLRHELADAAARDHFVQGWRYQLAVLANAVCDEVNASAAIRADQWFAAWNEPDAARRREALSECCVEQVAFADRYSNTHDRDDLEAHVAASKVHMPGVTLSRAGEARHCQGVALVDWTVAGADDKPMARGTNLFEFAPDGRIARVVGFWG